MTQLLTEPKKGALPTTSATPSKDGSISAFGTARSTIPGSPLRPDEVRRLDAFWRACNYLALGMTYLKANPLLKEPLKPEHIKDRLLGHWGASPGLAFCYLHLSRAIKAYDLDVVFMAGPGHGAPGVARPVSISEGSYSEVYPDCSEDEEGLLRCSSSSVSPAGSAATARRRRPAPSTKAANSATSCPMPAARRLTTPT